MALEIKKLLDLLSPQSFQLLVISDLQYVGTSFLRARSPTVQLLALNLLRPVLTADHSFILQAALNLQLSGEEWGAMSSCGFCRTTNLASVINGHHLFDLDHNLYIDIKLSGGGGDGGATGAESRDCYLNMYADKKPDKVDPHELRLSKWLNCSLSNEPLRQPCVIDRLGNMFNKEALVELEVVPGEGSGNARFQCPVTGLEFNGKYKFFALKNCGHVLSAKALKEVKSSECLVCYKAFEECDKIVINGSEEEVAVLRERMEERSKMKEKKMKKVKNGEVGANGEEFSGQGVEVSQLSGKKHGIVDVKGVDKVVGKVKGNGKVENVKGVSHGGSVKRFKATDMVPTNATKEFIDDLDGLSSVVMPLLGRRSWYNLEKRFVGSVSSEGGESVVEMYDFFGNDLACGVCLGLNFKMSVMHNKDSIFIKKIWSYALEREFKLILNIIDGFPYIAMDIEFPGIVLRPVRFFKTSFDYNYQTLKANAELLDLIQLDLPLSDEKGNLPACGTDKYCIWQFSLCDFNLDEDVYANDSIQLLL
ncbi:hypothetical protein D5086_032298 [Populus alba]|uniref:Uncharacterized protein n=1 Tax=Populus alba TaxID=43335 RepID=A0ACC4ALU7_POPAL